MAYAKQLRESLGRCSHQMNKIVTKAKSQGRGLTPEERTEFELVNQEYEGLERSILMEERARDVTSYLEQTPNSSEPRINETQMQEMVRDHFRLDRAAQRVKTPSEKAFSNYLRGGIERLSEDDKVLLKIADPSTIGSIRNAMSTTVGTQGAYIVPIGFSKQLEEAMKWFGGIAGTCDVFQSETGQPLPWPTVNDTTNRGRIIGQNVQITETDLLFDQVTLNAYIGTSDLVLLPLALAQDSFFDIDALVAKLIGIRLGRLYNWKCTIGTGVNEPTGIVTAAQASGNVLQLATGNTNTIGYNNLVDLEHSVDPAYRDASSCRWMFSDAVLKTLKKQVDGNGRPLWQPGLLASFREGASVDVGTKPTILGYEYRINQDMAAPAASAYSMVFGDMSTFKVREVAGGTTLLVLRERYADYLQIGFCGFRRWDSNLIDAGTHPLAVLQQSAT